MTLSSALALGEVRGDGDACNYLNAGPASARTTSRPILHLKYSVQTSAHPQRIFRYYSDQIRRPHSMRTHSQCGAQLTRLLRFYKEAVPDSVASSDELRMPAILAEFTAQTSDCLLNAMLVDGEFRPRP